MTTGGLSDAIDIGTWMGRRRPAALPLPLLPELVAGSGAGLRIALLDGQVDTSHPDLRGARVRCWSPRGRSTPDPTGHATACASLLVGQGASQILGLVPEAELLAAAVLGDNLFEPGSDELVAQGIGWAAFRGAQVLVLPFGRRRVGRRVTSALRSVIASGVTVFAAAGNLGSEVLTFPAAVTGVRAVTAHDDDGLLPWCSDLADLAAPGHDVPAAGAAGRVRLEGSSPAAVLAAGAHGRTLVAAAPQRAVAAGPARPSRLTVVADANPAGRYGAREADRHHGLGFA